MTRAILRRFAVPGLAAALVAAVFAFVGTSAAGAEERWFSVRLYDGRVVTVAVDAPADAPLEEIVLPMGFGGEILEEVPVPPDPVEEDSGEQTADSGVRGEPSAEPAEPSAREEREQQRSGSDRRSHPDGAEKRRRAEARREAEARSEQKARRRVEAEKRRRRPDITPPSPADPSYFDALPGPARSVDIPDFVIRKFRVPVFLLPIYQAAATEYGIRWEYLAAINEIETDYGRNLNVSSAGALGWMQFMPGTWRHYGVDANRDRRKDPYNPVDAIFAAARYLKAAGAPGDMRTAIFAYNHADWYVDSVILRARLIAGLPADLVGSLTGLTEGRFPIAARARYADDERRDPRPPGIDIHASDGAPVIAAADGVVRRHGRYSLVVEDAYGNRFTYHGIRRAAPAYPVTRPQVTAEDDSPTLRPLADLGPVTTKQRLFAHPERQPNWHPAKLTRVKKGSRVLAGAVLGRVGKRGYIRFQIRPAGRGAPAIDPKPILDGWKLLESTAIYRANGRNVLYGDDGDGLSIGQIVLLPKPLLEKRVLSDERIEIYACGRRDIRGGQIDRRVLATLAYLAESGLRPTVSSLHCGHSYLTKSGNVSHHSTGTAVDIARINGIPILGHQDRGGITEQTVRRLMTLQGTLAPAQIISLLDLGANTLVLADHDDHIHVGWTPNAAADGPISVLKAGQWDDLIGRLGRIDQPDVPAGPSRYALPARGSGD